MRDELQLHPADGIGSRRGAAVRRGRGATLAAGPKALATSRATARWRDASEESEIARLQRARLLAAATEIVEETGYAQFTVSRTVQRARVSRKTFYDIFSDREDCFLAVIEQAAGTARHVAIEAYLEQASWRAGMRSALETVLVLMEENPGLARIFVVDALGGGPRILRFRLLVQSELAASFDLGRTAPTARRDHPSVTGEAIAGGLLSMLFNRLHHGPKAPLTDLLGALMSIVTLPYLGARIAGEELTRSASGERPKVPRISTKRIDPLRTLNIRLTRRTCRVLMVIGQSRGASNIDIARHAGIKDQGQVSKLLKRLSRLGLIVNTGPGQRGGGSNAWRLTDGGEHLWPELRARQGRDGQLP
jgi:AcrR family transcriptional regulator/DNA-binding MarR family transcriptional regulator